MCDTVVFVPEKGPVWFAKNSDREPSEVQWIECHDRSSHALGRPSGLPEAVGHGRTIVSRPAWMWGAEIGVNEHGVAIGNEAVFTKVPVAKRGYTGMDFLRVALSTCSTADDALEALIELTEIQTQGGAMGHRHRSFRYHSSFIVADRAGAWVFETAGEFWAAKRVRGLATISNGLTIGRDFDRVHANASSYARRRGWLRPGEPFDFARAFSNRVVTSLAGADVRQSCTSSSLSGATRFDVRHLIRALSDHGGTIPGRAWRSESPCAHAAWLPTMTAAQTTSSLIARLDATGPMVWGTGTSSPCLSAFKPIPFDPAVFVPHPVQDETFDATSLWWAHERLHRACLRDYATHRAVFEGDRARFQDACLDARTQPTTLWDEHLALANEWFTRVASIEGRSLSWLRRRYWTQQSTRDRIPAT